MADYVDDLLKREEKRTQGTLKDVRQMQGSIPLPRPGIGTLFTPAVQSTSMTFPSKAPAGMGNAVKGDLGMYRGEEADKQKGFKNSKSAKIKFADSCQPDQGKIDKFYETFASKERSHYSA